MEIQGKRLRVRRGGARAGPGREPRSRKAAAADQERASRTRAADAPDLAGPTAEVNVIGQRVEEALDAVEKALDQALLAGRGAPAGHPRPRHGAPARRPSASTSARHGSVASLRAADAREGGNGATILELR